MSEKDRQMRRRRLKIHIRKKIFGTAERPRLTVYRSLKHIYAQIIDDTTHRVLVTASTLSKDIRDELKELTTRKEVSRRVGYAIAKKALERNITKVVFDRNGYLYHGHVKNLADGAREGGLQF